MYEAARKQGEQVLVAVDQVSTAVADWAHKHRSGIQVGVGVVSYVAGAVALFKATTVTVFAAGAVGVIGGCIMVTRGLIRPKA